MPLYIPIWWYSNDFKPKSLAGIRAFTFQSGDIQIRYNLLKNQASDVSLYIPIWWYSNQMRWLKKMLFKQLYIPIWWYSNQNDIQFMFDKLFTLHSNLVIFKLWQCYVWRIFEKSLHSNLVIFKYKYWKFLWSRLMSFTFQSGDIQIETRIASSTLAVPFTFQSGDIQMDVKPIKLVPKKAFTFQSGDIQILI